jgi:predicted porin
MKLTYAALGASLLLAGLQTAHAQSNVQIYGVLDVAVEHVTNSTATGGGLTRMPSSSGGIMPSRIGFRGTEDIGDGLKVMFVLENGFSPDTGVMSQGNRLFGRQAWVGLQGNWGMVSLGRTYSMLFSSFFDSDVLGPSQFSIGSLDSYLPNARHDNSVAYRGSFGGVTLGATYSLGRDASAAGGPTGTNCAGEVASDSRACRNWSALLKYDASNWGVVGAYDRYNGGTGALAAFGPTSSAQSDTRTHVGGYVKVGDWKLAGGLVRRDNEGSVTTPKSDLGYLGVSYPLTALLMIDAQAARLDFKHSNRSADLLAIRANYSLSKRTSTYVMVGNLNNDGGSAIALSSGGSVGAGMTQTGVLAGIRHAF